MIKNKYKVLDLFSGAGGMSEGFLQAGFSIPNACDFSVEASITYKNRHEELGHESNFFCGDIRLLTEHKKLEEFLGGEEISVIVGGPPCQGFSLTGKRDKNDVRNVLFFEFLKIVKLVKPKYFIMENVIGILSYRFKKFVGLTGVKYTKKLVTEIIINEAKLFGYHVEFMQLNAKDYGVPQNRPRVIFLGHQARWEDTRKIDLVVAPKFPIGKMDKVTVADAISDLRDLKNGGTNEEYCKRYKLSDYQKKMRNGLTPNSKGITLRSEKIFNHQAAKHRKKTIERFTLLKHGESIGELLGRLSDEERVKYQTKKYRCTKLDGNCISPTVLTLPDDIIHYEKGNSRILTVRELARLQSFDDSFKFLGKRTTGGDRRKFETPQYTQVGNAVPPLFAKAIADEILIALHKSEVKERELVFS
ncbi:cytosine-specific methyltransferase [Paenibacillus segetis]|uniref:Cytosine-specific methyltransferase n=2 Tax=Paenibacillus segetis TaxID=1325360 RepID=A0ABQ1Y4S1_9BACL|nr:cytosine-specific methyltransferase [Paenibacillus segetis]